MAKKTGKRDSLFILSVCLCALSFAGALLYLPQANAAGKTLLQQSDFRYIGAFAMPPSTPGGEDTTFGLGLTHRYVSGELRMFSTAWPSHNVYEVRVPALSTSGTLNQAQVVRDWGDVSGSKRYTGSGAAWVYGLYWDEPDRRLYWSYGDPYNVSNPNDPAVGYSTLNDSTGTATPVGAYIFNGSVLRMYIGCVMTIPQWFVDAYTGGKRLGAGCGGYFSGVHWDSMGPSLGAFSPPASSLPDRSSLSITPLVGYPDDSKDTMYSYERCHRDTNYIGAGNWVAWDPRNGVGYWTAGDYIYQGGIWIDLPDKHGVVYFPSLGNGQVYYDSGMHLAAEGSSHWWFLYDPADLARVAQGQVNQSALVPVRWPIKYPDIGVNYDLGPFTGGALPQMVTGVTFDPTNRRLYVALQLGAPGGAYGTTKVFVYEIQSGSPSDSTPPAAPTRMRVG
jgi:hypothetical protein